MPDKWITFGPDGGTVEHRKESEAERAARNYVSFLPAGVAPPKRRRRPSRGAWAIIIVVSAFVLIVAGSLLASAQMNSVSLFVGDDALKALNASGSQPTSSPADTATDRAYLVERCRTARDQHTPVEGPFRSVCRELGVPLP